METTCSIDRQETAEVCCTCVYPLPSLCFRCKDKHCAAPGFHFLLPLSAYRKITSQRDQMRVQPWLFQLNNTYQELSSVLMDMDKCQERIEAAYQELIQFAYEMKVGYQERLAVIRQGYLEALQKSIQETSVHALERKEYVPGDPLSRLIWQHDPENSEELEFFSFYAHCFPQSINDALKIAFHISLPGLDHLNMAQDSPSFPVTVQSTELGLLHYGMKSSDQISALKSKLAEEKDIPVNAQILSMKGTRLEDIKTFGDYGIREAVVLDLEVTRMQIFIRHNGRTIALNVSIADTIETVKGKIQDKEGLPPDRQRLYLSGKQLGNGKRLGSYQVMKEATLEVKLI